MPAKPLRMALGSLMIQKQYGYSDRELLEQIVENPYYQYYIGLPGFSREPPFVPSPLVKFRKCLDDDVMNEINEMIFAYNTPDDPRAGDGGDASGDISAESENSGTIILEITCASQNISYPQGMNLLNAARENLETLIDTICYDYNYYKSRMCRESARKDYLNLANCKKRTTKKIRKTIKSSSCSTSAGIDVFLADGAELTPKQSAQLSVLRQVYEQHKNMHENNTHTVADRIASISQPYIRLIVRGKAVTPVEFGAKLDLSSDENGMARLEKLSFDAYNESDVLIGALERYRERIGHYPERTLADKIYRNRDNLAFCKKHGIRLSGPRLGRPKKDASVDKRRNTLTMQTAWKLNGRSALPKDAMGLAGS